MKTPTQGLSVILSSALIAAVATLAAMLPFARSAHAGGACRGMPFDDEATTTVVIDEAMCFQPEVARIEPGSTVTWENPPSGVPHTITGSNLAWGDYGEISPGVSNSYRFDQEGVFPYFCYLHPSMVGAVVVGDGVGGDAPAAADSESVSLTGRALLPPPTAAVTSSNDGGFDSLWLIAPLAAAVALAAGGAGYLIGARRASS